MFRHTLAIIIFLVSVVIFTCKGENIEKMKQYSDLLEEGKISGIADLLKGVTPENIEQKILYVSIQSDKEREEKFYSFQAKLHFIKETAIYPSLDNLISVGLSENKYSKNARVIALRILASKYTKLETNKPSVNAVEDFLKNCIDIELEIEGVPLLTRLDKGKGFAVADKIISDKGIGLKDKMNLSCRLIPFAYTGGYMILKELIKSNDPIIKLNIPMLIDYYEQYNGEKATNTEITIDTTAIATK